MRIRWINAALWGGAVVLAVGAGTAAVAAASNDSGRHVLSRQEVARELAGLPSAAPSAARVSPGADDNGQALWVTGGGVVVSCDGDTATLLRWSPASGYRGDDPHYGPAASVSVRFESDGASDDNAPDVFVSVRCVNGVAVKATKLGDDHGHDGATPQPSAGGGRDNGGDHGGDDNGKGNSGKGSGGGTDDPTGHH